MRLPKSRAILLAVLSAVALYAVVTLIALQPKINALRAANDETRTRIAELTERNDLLRSDIAALGSELSVAKLARERLMMIADGEIIYIDSNR